MAPMAPMDPHPWNGNEPKSIYIVIWMRMMAIDDSDDIHSLRLSFRETIAHAHMQLMTRRIADMGFWYVKCKDC